MTKARLPKELPAETLAIIAAHRSGHIVAKWRTDDAATTTRLLLEMEPALGAALRSEIDALIARIAHSNDEQFGRSVKIGGAEVQVGGREIRIGRRTYLASACTPGLFTRETMPREEGVHMCAMERINTILGSKRIKPQVIDAEPWRTGYATDYAYTSIKVVCPEARGETYEITLHLEHKPDAEIDRICRETARVIEARYRHRAAVKRMRNNVEAAVAAAITDPTMRVVGSVFSVNMPRAIRGEKFDGHAYAQVETLGNNLEPRIDTTSADGDRLKTLTAKHRANRRHLADREVGDALACEPVLANAIHALPDRYAAGLLGEIEKVVGGQSAYPSEPRRRGISNVSIDRGVVRAAVTIGNGVRLEKGRIRISSIKTLPETLLVAMKGRPMRDVVEHELLEGLVIKTAAINGNGLRLRPAGKPPALAPLLDVLRGKAEAHAHAVAAEAQAAAARKAARNPTGRKRIKA